MKKYKLRCELLSPVHIGAGDAIDPLNYIIVNRRLHKVSFENFVLSMDDSRRKAFEGIIDKGDLVEIRRYVADNVRKEKDITYAVAVTPNIETLYKSKIGDIQNQLILVPFIRTEGDSVPLIPGSSLKGAIRTAVISEIAKNSNLPKPRDVREEYAFESQVLGYKDGKDDPFRGIKIRDRSLQKDDTIVREVKNVSRKKGGPLQSNNIQMICEVTHSHVTGQPVNFDTEICLDDVLFSTGFLSREFSIEQIIASCRDFYKDKMEHEHKKFYKNSEVEKLSAQLLNTTLEDKSFLLRVGRFSGVESVTLDNYRNPKPPGNKAVWGTSRNLAEGLYPMGWVKVTVSEESVL